MNSKELKIEAPEGYEIDWENSSKTTIRFKPSKKKVTYKDICRELFLDRPSWRLTDTGVPICATCTSSAYIHHSSISTSRRQLEQLLALNKLMNVANYLNGDWEPNWNTYDETKWFIFFDHDKKNIQVRSWYIINPGCVYFKSIKLALQAIEILGEEKVKKALGIFE
jgi:hypothetical protein